MNLLEESKIDPLTGLHNRREFAVCADREIEKARRYSDPLSIIFFDLDGLKKINDEYGHHAGDLAICRLSESIKSSLRMIDYSFRMGGDEFIVILPHTDASGAHKVAQRVKSGLIEKRPSKIVVEASFGISAFQEGMSIADMVREADHRMYKDKKKHDKTQRPKR